MTTTTSRAAMNIIALTLCGVQSIAMLTAQFAVAIAMAVALSKMRICRSSSTNGKGRRLKWKASMCKMERQNTCGGEQSLRSKGIFFSDKICQYLGDK